MSIDNWVELFDLTLPPIGAAPAAGAMSDDLPVIADDLNAILDLASALDGVVPQIQITGFDAGLRTELVELGFVIESFPGGPEGGRDATELRVRFQSTVDDLIGSSTCDGDAGRSAD